MAWASSAPFPGLAYVVMTRRTGMLHSFRVVRDRHDCVWLASWCSGQARAIVPQEDSRCQQSPCEQALAMPHRWHTPRGIGQMFDTLIWCRKFDGFASDAEQRRELAVAA